MEDCKYLIVGKVGILQPLKFHLSYHQKSTVPTVFHKNTLSAQTPYKRPENLYFLNIIYHKPYSKNMFPE